MKSQSLKVLGCAAATALFTIARAQVYENNQFVPQQNDSTAPNNGNANGNGQQQDQNGAVPNQNGSTQPQQPNVVLVPMPVEMQDTNFQVAPQPGQQPPAQGGTINPNQTYRVLPPAGQTQNQNRYDRRNRFERRGEMSQQRQSANTDASAYVPPANAGTNGTDGILLNFHGAPIDEVLNYLSDAAGFIIELDTHVTGTVDVWSAHPVSKDEAVQILNSVLNREGFAAVRNGRTLRIMTHDNAIHSQIPVIVNNDPKTVPDTDEIVTQIIPIRFVQARQLISDLSPLISSQATIMANEAGNSIIVTDTQANIRHLMEIIQAIDGSAEDVTEVRVFHLQYHDPVEVANMLTSIFADQSGGQNAQASPIRFGGGFPGFGGGGGFRRFFGGGGPGGFGGQGGAAGGNNQNDRIRQRSHVVAVADQRTQSVLVTAPKDLMDQIGELVTQIDQESPKVSRVSVIHLENADPTEVQKVLQQFQANNGRSSQNSQDSVLQQREKQNSSSSTPSGFGASSGFGNGGLGNGFGGGSSSGFGGAGGGVGGGFRGGGQ